MTFQSLALRIKEVRDLQKEYQETLDMDVLDRLTILEAELDRLVNSIVVSYHKLFPQNSGHPLTDVEQY